MSTDFMIEVDRLAEALDPTVRHNLLVCMFCQDRYPSYDSIIGKSITTICDRIVIYKLAMTWCPDCVVVRINHAYIAECGVCGHEIDWVKL